MEEVSDQVEKVQAPIPVMKPDLSFGCQYRNQVSVVHLYEVLKVSNHSKLLHHYRIKEQNNNKLPYGIDAYGLKG